MIDIGYIGESRSQPGITFTVIEEMKEKLDNRRAYKIVFNESGHEKIYTERDIIIGRCWDKDIIEGCRYKNRFGEWYTVKNIDINGTKPHKRRHFIEFDNNPGILLSKLDQDITAGKCRNPYSITLYGVAAVGQYDFSLRYAKYAKSMWDSMLKRCYNKEHVAYKNYGRKGVHVCDRWLLFENFINDLPTIDGWDEDQFIKRQLVLDKDKKAKNEKIYSKETCCLMSRSDNSKISSVQYLVIDNKSNTSFIGSVSTFINKLPFKIDKFYNTIKNNNCVCETEDFTIIKLGKIS